MTVEDKQWAIGKQVDGETKYLCQDGWGEVEDALPFNDSKQAE